MMGRARTVAAGTNLNAILCKSTEQAGQKVWEKIKQTRMRPGKGEVGTPHQTRVQEKRQPLGGFLLIDAGSRIRQAFNTFTIIRLKHNLERNRATDAKVERAWRLHPCGWRVGLDPRYDAAI